MIYALLFLILICIGLNVNADVICERLKSCEDKLEAIKANTRKRGL